MGTTNDFTLTQEKGALGALNLAEKRLAVAHTVFVPLLKLKRSPRYESHVPALQLLGYMLTNTVKWAAT